MYTPTQRDLKEFEQWMDEMSMGIAESHQESKRKDIIGELSQLALETGVVDICSQLKRINRIMNMVKNF